EHDEVVARALHLGELDPHERIIRARGGTTDINRR
ncbi:MAG: hypothetical protein JWQ33_1079, partial [Ramlibacter sp.]|nr:hypothetical protein [Ramlibacter sp.]